MSAIEQYQRLPSHHFQAGGPMNLGQAMGDGVSEMCRPSRRSSSTAAVARAALAA